MRCQSRFDARYWMLGASALGQPRGMVWGGRREKGSGWGTHVYLWWIHFDIWQNKYNYVKFKNRIKLKKHNWSLNKTEFYYSKSLFHKNKRGREGRRDWKVGYWIILRIILLEFLLCDISLIMPYSFKMCVFCQEHGELKKEAGGLKMQSLLGRKSYGSGNQTLFLIKYLLV